MHGFVVFLLLVFSALCTTAPFGYSEELNGFSLELIHHDSPLSPFYNSSKSISELMTDAVLRSISRVSSSLLSNEKESSLKTILIPGIGDYLMRIYIGTPPVQRFAIADTGSDLVWIQCSPCDSNTCFPQDTPYYNPKTSSTFTSVPCDSKPCTYISQPDRSCGKSGQCEYKYSYAGSGYTNGELGVDSINFGDDVSVKFPKSIFGCGHNNSVVTKGIQKTTGLVGLGAGPLSLVSQLGDSIGHKFSYCLVPPFSSNSTSKMKFGNKAKISGKGVVSTTFIIKPSLPSFYIINLEGVTIGQKRVQPSHNYSGNIIIDSGTTYTLLELNLYNDFVASVKEAIGVETQVEHPQYSFCFNAEARVNFPDFVFHFAGADVTLKPINLFVALDNFICLGVLPVKASFSVFGNLAQLNFQVEFNLKQKTVSFAPTDCTKN